MPLTTLKEATKSLTHRGKVDGFTTPEHSQRLQWTLPSLPRFDVDGLVDGKRRPIATGMSVACDSLQREEVRVHG